MTAATRIQEDGRMTKNATNFSNEIVPMEKVSLMIHHIMQKKR
jgi:hypothetical protein